MADDGTSLCNCMNGKSVDKVDKEMMTINGYLFRLCRVTASASMRQKNYVNVVCHIFLFFPLKTDLYRPKTPDFATIKNQEKIPGNYCMSKGDFPHLNFYYYPH